MSEQTALVAAWEPVIDAARAWRDAPHGSRFVAFTDFLDALAALDAQELPE